MQLIDIEVEGGSLEGYVVDAREPNLEHYFEKYTNCAGVLLANLRAEHACVALLKNINVEEEVRGNGIGSELLMLFLEQANDAGAEAFLLIADHYEGQSKGFVLTDWYESFGFINTPLLTSGGPLMVMPERLVEYAS